MATQKETTKSTKSTKAAQGEGGGKAAKGCAVARSTSRRPRGVSTRPPRLPFPSLSVAARAALPVLTAAVPGGPRGTLATLGPRVATYAPPVLRFCVPLSLGGVTSQPPR